MSFFVGNFKASKDLETWLQRDDFPTALSPASVLFIIGPTGIGKTHGVRAACSKYGFNLQTLDTNEVTTFKEFYDVFHKMAASDITVQFAQKSRQSMVFCIDEMEAFVSLDRTFLASFQKMLHQGNLPHVRIIVTAQQIVQRKILDMHERGTKIEMAAPSDSDVFAFLKTVAPKGTHVKDVLQVADTCNGNLNFALQTLQVISRPSEEAVKVTSTDKTWSLADVFLRPDPENILRLFLDDPWLFPLRFHENLIYEWKQRKGTNATKRECHGALMRNLCEWDLMMSHYRGEDFSIPIDFIARGISSHMVGFPRKKTAGAPRDEFTKIFSYLSLSKKNQQALQSALCNQPELDGLHSFHHQLLTKRKNISTK